MISSKNLRGLTLAMMAVGLLCGAVFADQARRVLILPLGIHADKDVSFLQDGIRSMLSSRLYQPGKTVIVSREETLKAVEAHGGEVTTDPAAVALAKQLKADYVVAGSLMMMGDSVSTNLRMLDVGQNKPVAAVNQVGKNQGAVIEHIDLFCARVNEDVFGSQPRQTGKPAAKAQVVDQQRMHPEKLMRSDVREEPSGMGMQPNMAAAGAWRIGRQFKTQLLGLAVGDVNGDGRADVAVIDNHTLNVFQYQQGHLIPMGILEEGKFNSFISVDVADINGNGNAEIFITNRPLIPAGHAQTRAFGAKTPQLRSFVVEWDGTQFKKILEDDTHFFRVLHIPQRGAVLVGQRQGVLSDTFGENKIFAGPVTELVWRGGALVAEDNLGVPARMNLFSFAIGDIDNNGREMILSYSHMDYLRLSDRAGDEQWQSAENYGTTDTYLEIPDAGDMRDMNRYYLPSRIIVTAPASDGAPTVLVVKNTEAGRTFPRVKIFNSGYIEYLAWNGLSLVPAWRTQPVSKFISDFALGDLDNDGQDELVFAVVVKTASAFSEGKSTIVFQDLPEFKKPSQN
jgi:TolB-like protein